MRKGTVPLSHDKQGGGERLVGKKNIDWAAIQAEYIGGNIGQKRLAEMHGVTVNALKKRAVADGWYQLKLKARAESGLKAVHKTAEAAAENAVVAERIRAKLLARLEKLADVTLDATETRDYDGPNLVAINRLRDLTSALKDLTGDKVKVDLEENALQQAREILGGVDSAIT